MLARYPGLGSCSGGLVRIAGVGTAVAAVDLLKNLLAESVQVRV